MKKRIIFATIIFALIVILIKGADVVNKYEVSISDYMKYSQPLTHQERNYLKENGIFYGISSNNPPFTFVSEATNQNVGIVVDYFNQLSVVLENPFQPVVYDDFSLAIKLKNNKVDAAVLNRTKINESVFLFTQPLYTEKSKILVGGDSLFRDTSDVKNLSLAVISGSGAHHGANLFFSGKPDVHLVLAKDLTECFYLFGCGEVDGIIGDEAKLSYHLNREIKEKKYKFLSGSVFEEDVALAVNKEQTILYDILNKGILEMKKNNQYSHINSKWFGSFIPEVNDVKDKGRTAEISIFILGIVFFFMIWNSTVSNKVAIKTRQLQESREDMLEILNSLNNSIIVTDFNGIVKVCNKTAEKVLGVSFDKIKGRKVENISELAPFLDKANHTEAFGYKDRYYLVEHRAMGESPNKYLIFIEDYTERYQYERINRQEAKMMAVGELSAGLAHEIRNPLGLIKSYLYILQKKVDDSLGQHAMKVMEDSVGRINRLIENLLGFSKMSMDKATKVNIEELILSLIDLEEKQLLKNEIVVHTDFGEKIYEKIRVNEDVIKLVIINLMNNSIDALIEAGKEEKKIDIAVRFFDDVLQINFFDNGTGIPEEKLEAIFNPFYTSKDTGTGLGLYIINSEISQIGGSIYVTSSEGEWTRFHIELPIESGDENGE